MAKFDLGAFAQTLQSVPKSGTSGAERIEYIPLAGLHADERNFYQLSGIEDLAANIQLCGLMDPLRVRKADDGYTIVSGHRRFAGCPCWPKRMISLPPPPVSWSLPPCRRPCRSCA